MTAAYTRRYANTLSNSTRVFANFGNGKDDEGVAIISENSLISGLPSTLIPYANFFVGFGNPQPLVDGNGAGILKNVGINFETDALTGYPKLNDTGSNAFGGAIGLQYLFNLDQQLVFEVATVQPFGDPIAGIGVAHAAVRLRRALSDPAQPGVAVPRRCDLSDHRGRRRRQLRHPRRGPQEVLTDDGADGEQPWRRSREQSELLASILVAACSSVAIFLGIAPVAGRIGRAVLLKPNKSTKSYVLKNKRRVRRTKIRLPVGPSYIYYDYPYYYARGYYPRHIGGYIYYPDYYYYRSHPRGPRAVRRKF